MKRRQLLLLSLLSAALLSIPYYRWGPGLLMLVAFVPLLLIEEEVARRRSAREEGSGEASNEASGANLGGAASDNERQSPSKGPRLMGWVFLSFGLWVFATTYWVYWATWIGIVASVIVNTGYMALTFGLFSFTKRRLGPRLGYAALVVFWLCFEFLYLRAQVNFPWLILGNAFAYDPILIQWYEVTGVLGGSLWVLLVNLAVFHLIQAWRREGLKFSGRPSIFRSTLAQAFSLPSVRNNGTWVLGLLLIPVSFSLVRFITYTEKGETYEMVVLQPNIDPWMKFKEMPQSKQTERLLHIADSLVTPQTEYIIGPETFINRSMWHDQLATHPEIRKIKGLMADYPRAKMVIGATTLKLYRDSTERSSTARPLKGNMYFDSYNSALQLDESGVIPLYHKSRLVAGVETMPHKELLGFLEKLTVHLGGTFRSQGTQDHRDAFPSPQDSTRVGPVICWESVFGEFVTEYVKDADAHFLFIITNDGWWRKTAGHRQHNAYARIRAIENRRSIARSANTGISSLINQRGQEIDRVGWWQISGIRGELHKNERKTFYTRHGDYLGRMAGFLAVILLLYAMLHRYIIKEK